MIVMKMPSAVKLLDHLHVPVIQDILVMEKIARVKAFLSIFYEVSQLVIF